MQLTQSLHRALTLHPKAIATVCGPRRRSFAELGERVARLAAALHGLGVTPGDRVGMLALNSDRYVEVHMAVPWAGAVINPVNTRWSAAEIAYSLDDCDTRVLLIDDALLPLLPELRRLSRSLHTVVHVGDGAPPEGLLSYESLIDAATPAADAMRGGAELAGIYYTGGTTGFPKGVMLSHDGLCLNGLLMVAEGVVREGAIGLHAAPMFHLADIVMLNGLWAVGATHVTLPSFTPLGVAQAIERERIDTSVLVPTMIQALVDHADAMRHDLSSLRTLLYGGSPISEALLERVQRALPQLGLFQTYGMTEMSPLMTMLPPSLHSGPGRARGKIRSAGRACLGIQMRIVDAAGRELPRGEVGEIAVRGAGVMLGYWNQPQATQQALREGWLHTGDAGRMDDEGFVFVVDRLKDMIISGGENVYCAEVEQALAQHPAVAACAVIGVPDERWGERVHAVVILKTGQQTTEAELHQHCKTLIAGYKCPKSVEFVAALPMSGAGKVQKTKLREPHWAGHERRVA